MANICVAQKLQPFFCDFFLQCSRPLTLLCLYILGGLLGIAFLLVPASQILVRTVLFILCQGVIVADFFLVDTYTPEVLSTDIRNFGFALLDCSSKV